MGWASGSGIMSAIIRKAKKNFPDQERQDWYTLIIDVLTDADWDTETECLGEDTAYDAALKELHPEYFEKD